MGIKIRAEDTLTSYPNPTRQELVDWLESIYEPAYICPRSKADFGLRIDQHIDPTSPLNTCQEVQGYTSKFFAWRGRPGVIVCHWEKDGDTLFAEEYEGDGEVWCYVGEEEYVSKIY